MNSRNSAVSSAVNPSMTNPSGACTVANKSDSVVGVMKELQLTAAKIPSIPRTHKTSTVRRFVCTYLLEE